jgi:hypothetical protein
MLGADVNDRLIGTASDGGAVVLVHANTTAGPGAVAAALLQQLPAASGDGLWIALAPPADPQLPGEVLRQLRAAGHAVQGFVDRAALLAAWLPDATELAVVELSRRHFSVSLAGRDRDTAALRRHVPLQGGEQALRDAWLRLAAATLVQQTRFDPLHDARHEAELRERIVALAADAQRIGQGQCEIGTGTTTTVLALTRDQLAAAAAPVLAPLQDALQALAAAHGDAALVLGESLLLIPGIDAVLAAAGFARTCSAADGLPARAASLLAPSGVAAAGGVPYLTRLPLLAAPAPPDALAVVETANTAARAMATHVVYGGRVLAIPADGLVIGREPGPAPSLRLPEGRAGVSRRHCTLRHDGARAQVIDHSSHGTFIDGARVRGRALLPAGATLRLGDPGIELPLVAIEAR